MLELRQFLNKRKKRLKRHRTKWNMSGTLIQPLWPHPSNPLDKRPCLHFRSLLSSCLLSLTGAPFTRFGFMPCSLLSYLFSFWPMCQAHSYIPPDSLLSPILGKQYVFPLQVLVCVFFFFFSVNLKIFCKNSLYFFLSGVKSSVK